MLKATPPRVPKPGQEARKIRAMFGSIAERYDLLNHLLSANTDIAWRRLVVEQVLTGRETAILDVACGTGDLALELHKSAPRDCTVVGLDFTGPMLRIARKKSLGSGSEDITWIEGDGLHLPFGDGEFDLLTIAFGIRNMESLEGALREMLRVLRPGGKLAILEFSQPDNVLIRSLYMPYFLHVLPRIGALLSRKSAYLYLPFSALHFPRRKELARLMLRCGYGRVRHCALSFGIAALHIGEKSPEA